MRGAIHYSYLGFYKTWQHAEGNGGHAPTISHSNIPEGKSCKTCMRMNRWKKFVFHTHFLTFFLSALLRFSALPRLAQYLPYIFGHWCSGKPHTSERVKSSSDLGIVVPDDLKFEVQQGPLPKKFLDSGVKKLIPLAFIQNAKESYENLEQIVKATNLRTHMKIKNMLF